MSCINFSKLKLKLKTQTKTELLDMHSRSWQRHHRYKKIGKVATQGYFHKYNSFEMEIICSNFKLLISVKYTLKKMDYCNNIVAQHQTSRSVLQQLI